MALINMRDVSLSIGDELLLDSVSLPIARNERACLVGRNGCGKSTLLKLLAGELAPDRGEILRAPTARAAYLPQEIPDSLHGRVRELTLSHPHRATAHNEANLALSAEQAMSRLGLNPEARFESLSGGMKRRVLLARTLASEADVLLLDEPTNHLDVETIEWLETYLARPGRTLVFVTHDRAFLRRLATRILDLDRGLLAGWDCDYDTFLRRKQQLLEDEEAIWEKRGKRLTREEIWIRQGIKARRTRDEGRVRALQALREQFRQRRQAQGLSRVQLHSAQASGDLALKAENVSFAYPGEAPVVRGFNLRLQRGERIGIVGPNGCGKTTLLKLATGALAPTEGTLTKGTRLEIVYLDQMRSALDGEKTIAQNVAGDGDTVMVGGRLRHVTGYLQYFLFTPARTRTRVKVLSGGERNRLLLAMMFLRPCNLLIMDEPTNDLDIETLDLLEEQLQRPDLTMLLVSHDRAFLNNVTTATLAFHGDGQFRLFAGGYDDWAAARDAARPTERRPAAAPKAPSRQTEDRRVRREAAKIGARIEALEAEQAALAARQSEPDFYSRPPSEIVAAQQRASALATEIEQWFERWAELENTTSDISPGSLKR